MPHYRKITEKNNSICCPCFLIFFLYSLTAAIYTINFTETVTLDGDLSGDRSSRFTGPGSCNLLQWAVRLQQQVFVLKAEVAAQHTQLVSISLGYVLCLNQKLSVAKEILSKQYHAVGVYCRQVYDNKEQTSFSLDSAFVGLRRMDSVIL